MKGFDHSQPRNRAEWIFAFIAEYRTLRPEIGANYARTHALTAYLELKELEPAAAAQQWAKRT